MSGRPLTIPWAAEHVPAIVRELSDRESLLVSAWTTVERRRAEGTDGSAELRQLVAAGLSPTEAMLLAAPHVATEVNRAGLRFPAFVLLPKPLAAPAHLQRYARFESAAAPVLPLRPSPALGVALQVLDNVRPSALAE